MAVQRAHKLSLTVHKGAYVQSSDPGGAFETTAGVFWVDTTSRPWRVKIRNAGNTGWDLLDYGFTWRAVSTATTWLVTDTGLLVDATAGAVTITLPSAVNWFGPQLKVKKKDSSANAVHIASVSSQTFDGAAGPLDLTTQGQVAILGTDQSNWWTG